MNQKVIGDFIFLEKLYSFPPRSYNKCYSKKSNSVNKSYYMAQTLSKPISANLRQQFAKLKEINQVNVLKHDQIHETTNNYYVFTEYCNEKTLHESLTKSGQQQPEDLARDTLRQILNGLKTLHEAGIVGVDLSLWSIFLHNGTVKIGQINLASNLQKPLETESDFQKLGVQIELQAPEILNGSYNTLYSDLYTVGVIYYRLLFGDFPFKGTNRNEILDKIRNGPVFPKGEFVSEESIDFIRQVLTFDSSQRPKWTNVYSHKLLGYLNIPADMNDLPIEQSILLDRVQLNQAISRHDLNAQPFDVKQVGDFYKNKEENQRQQTTTINDTSELSPTSEVNYRQSEVVPDIQATQYDQMKEIDRIEFQEQLGLTLKMQIQEFIMCRNVCSTYASVLSMVRVMSSQTLLERQLEYLILKNMLVSNTVLKQNLQNIEQAIIRCLDPEIQKDLISEYRKLLQLINRENEVIKNQYNQCKKIHDFYLGQNCKDESFKRIYNDLIGYDFLRDLMAKFHNYDQQLVKSALPAIKDRQIIELHLCRFSAVILLTSLISRGRNHEVKSVFGMEPKKYEKRLEELDADSLKEQKNKNKARIDALDV